MNEGLLIIERMIIESLSRKEKNIFELSSDTTIDQSLLLNNIFATFSFPVLFNCECPTPASASIEV
jgi:hypothetical protein